MADSTLHHSGRLDIVPEAVWPALSDLDRVADWHDAIVGSAAVPGGDPTRRRWRVGSRWIEGEIVGLEPQRRIAVRLREPATLVREALVTVTVEPAERGTTLRIELSLTTPALAAPLGPWLRLRAEVELHRALRSFRSWLGDRLALAKRAAAMRREKLPPVLWPAVSAAETAGREVVGS